MTVTSVTAPAAPARTPQPAAERALPWLRRPVVLAPITIGICVAIFVLTGPPHVGDLAAQVARAKLFGRVGFVPWFAGWYGGMHLGGYSLITPELMWWLRPSGVGIACLVLTEAFGYALLRAGGARRPGAGAAALTVFQLADLLSGRVTFAVGGVVVIAAVIAIERDSPILAGGLGILASITSPVDGVVAGLVAAAYLVHAGSLSPVDGYRAWVADLWRTSQVKASVALLAGAGFGLLAIVKLFPDPGFEPFTFSTMLPAFGTCLVIALLPVGRVVRRGALLAAVFVFGCYLIHSPIGSNATRLPLLLGVPAVVASLRSRIAVTASVVAALLVWPALQLHHDLTFAGDPAAKASYFSPLVAELRDNPQTLSHRVEVIEPRTHWQVVYLEPTVTLARGWERQLDASLNPAFYSGSLTAASYRSFLHRNAVAVVAAPHNTPLDFGSVAEARLVDGGLPYLHKIWADSDWTVYAVNRPSALTSGAGAVVTRLTATGVRLTTARAGIVKVRLRYSPYLSVTGGSVSRGSDGDVVLRLRQAGPHDLHAVWSVGGLARALA